MNTFFWQTAQAMIAKHIDRIPLVKVGAGDWLAPDRTISELSKTPLPPRPPQPSRLSPVVHIQSRPARTMAHLSDPELEYNLITRIDFNLFCRFDELSIPDYSTLCRCRNRLAQDYALSELPGLINRQLTEKELLKSRKHLPPSLTPPLFRRRQQTASGHSSR